MATIYKIHPAIGIARVGNSDEFFIGPERINEYPQPQGGFKDNQCRVKRQAARFRIFAHHDDGSSEEITHAEAEIVWTVHLANRKAAYAGRGNSEPAADLVIDAGSRTLDGPNQRQLADTGQIRFSGAQAVTVPLGEIRSDTGNRLLVLGGTGRAASPRNDGLVDFWRNPGWYDDIADGPVSATIRLRSDNSQPAVVGAWVITAPPKFAPHQDNSITLYDRVLQTMVDANLATAPTQTSYVRDIYPVLQRARDSRWVRPNGAHNWADPVLAMPLRTAIFNRLKPASDMPALAGGDSGLTPVQMAHMQRWRDDTGFSNDWTGVPVPDATVGPDGMDRAALDACVGGSFYPGIEAGGMSPADRPILHAANYAEAFRINHATVAPGTISASMAVPWQADFYYCAGNWWPVPRPDRVTPQAGGAPVEWARGANSLDGMVANWHTLGFVVQQNDRKVEVERCDTASIMLLTPHLRFIDIPQGPMGMVREQPLAIAFEVVAPTTGVTLEYAPGGAPNHPQLVAANNSVTIDPTGANGMATARLWIVYRTGAAPSAIPTQTVTVREPVSGQTWNIVIDGNTVARKTSAVALVLDRSGSMVEDRGDGQSKHSALQQAAETFVDVMLEGDGVGLVRYDHDAQVVQPVTRLGAGGLSDNSRNQTIDLIRGNSFDPAGATSIGDGIHEGRQIVSAVAGDYDLKSMVVLTDGVENSPRYIADVSAEINETTYAIGLGTPQNTSAPALQTLSGNNGGFLLVTGAIAGDNRFLLQKYFLQVLAGVTNAEIVLDPDGQLAPGEVHRIPFLVTDADAGLDVILLSPHVGHIDFRLQTPGGQLLEPWRALAEPAMRYVLGKDTSYYRLVLPTQLVPERYDQGGTWHVVLTAGKPRMQPSRDHPRGIDASIARYMHAPAAVRAAWQQSAQSGVPNEMERRFALAQHYEADRGSDAAAVAAIASVEESGSRRALPYSVIVHSYSSLSLRGEVNQSGYEPGAQIHVEASLTSSGLPLDGAARVWIELVRPDGSHAELALDRTEPGRYAVKFTAGSVGLYRMRLRAHGRTPAGQDFSRERSLTAGVWRGGDRDHQRDPGRGHGRGEAFGGGDSDFYGLIGCLLGRGRAISPELERRLREAGIDLEKVRECLAKYRPSDRQPAPRE